MFIVALFAIAKPWKQPKSTDEWLKTMWYIFAATRMDLEIILLSEVRQRKRYHMISLIYGI